MFIYCELHIIKACVYYTWFLQQLYAVGLISPILPVTLRDINEGPNETAWNPAPLSPSSLLHLLLYVSAQGGHRTPTWAPMELHDCLPPALGSSLLEKCTSHSSSHARLRLHLGRLGTPIVYKCISRDGSLLDQLEARISCCPLTVLNLSFSSKHFGKKINTEGGIWNFRCNLLSMALR